MNEKDNIQSFDKIPAINLMFHDVKLNPSRWNTTPIRFEQIIRLIVKHGNASRVVITVDDAGKGNHEFIFPILEKYGLKGKFFVPTKYIASQVGRSTYMTRQQIRELSERGHVIGSHSHSHPKNISLLPSTGVHEEWSISKDILENIIGNRIVDCSIPGGHYSSAHNHIIAELGYNKIYNSVPIYNARLCGGIVVQGRFSIENNTSDRAMLMIMDQNIIYQTGLRIRQFLSQNAYRIIHRK